MAKGRIIRPEGQTFNLPRVGMIKTGFKNANGYPQSCDHFLSTGKYKSMFEKAYPGKPGTIQIVFWDDDPATMCEERYEYRDRDGRLYAKGDGTDFEVWHSGKEKYLKYSIDDHPFIMDEVHNKVKGKDWYVILTLRFIMPKVKEIAGYWEFSTKGEASSIPSIRDAFDAILQANGSIRGVIFDLNVQFVKSQKPGINSRYPVVSLVPNHSQENIQSLKGSMMNIERPKELGS